MLYTCNLCNIVHQLDFNKKKEKTPETPKA